MQLNQLETELKKRLTYPYHWGQKQNDEYDRLTSFIYKIYFWEELIDRLKNKFDQVENYNDFFHYAINRWYNFQSAQAVEHLFSTSRLVTPNRDRYDKLVDFKIKNISFDHKTSVFPKGFNQELSFALNNKRQLINWLYKNQSSQGRQHFGNRLFIVLYNSQNHHHWQLKSELRWLKTIIESYLKGYSEESLIKLNFKNREPSVSDIIWAVK